MLLLYKTITHSKWIWIHRTLTRSNTFMHRQISIEVCGRYERSKEKKKQRNKAKRIAKQSIGMATIHSILNQFLHLSKEIFNCLHCSHIHTHTGYFQKQKSAATQSKRSTVDCTKRKYCFANNNIFSAELQLWIWNMLVSTIYWWLILPAEMILLVAKHWFKLMIKTCSLYEPQKKR